MPGMHCSAAVCSLVCCIHTSQASVACRRQPVRYFEFRHVLVRHGSVVFVSLPNDTQQTVSSPIELFPRQRLTIDYQTAATAESSALATCVPVD